MNDADLYLLWEKLEPYINPKDKKEAVEAFLMEIYENGGNVYALLENSDETGDDVFSKVCRRFIKENGIDEEEW